MTRRLIIEVEHSKGGKIRGRIQVQTHKAANFTDNGNTFVASNGLSISSLASPEAHEASGVLYVRGEVEGDSGIFNIPSVGFLERMRVAVAEYNMKFSSKTKYEVIV